MIKKSLAVLSVSIFWGASAFAAVSFPRNCDVTRIYGGSVERISGPVLTYDAPTRMNYYIDGYEIDLRVKSDDFIVLLVKNRTTSRSYQSSSSIMDADSAWAVSMILPGPRAGMTQTFQASCSP